MVALTDKSVAMAGMLYAYLHTLASAQTLLSLHYPRHCMRDLVPDSHTSHLKPSMHHTMGILTVGLGGKAKTDVHGTEQPSYMEGRPPGLSTLQKYTEMLAPFQLPQVQPG